MVVVSRLFSYTKHKNDHNSASKYRDIEQKEEVKYGHFMTASELRKKNYYYDLLILFFIINMSQSRKKRQETYMKYIKI